MTMLSVAQAADRLGISRDGVRDYIAAGMLRAIRLPSLKRPGESRRRYSIREEDIQDFIRESGLSPVPNHGPRSTRKRPEMALIGRGQKPQKRGNLNWREEFRRA